MHPTIRPLAHCLAGAMLMLASACSSNSGTSSSSAANSGGQSAPSSSQAGHSGGASGGSQSSSASQGGHTSAPTAGSSAGSGGQSAASGGTSVSSKGGTSSTSQTGATGGSGQGGTTSRTSTSTSTGGAGGNTSGTTGGTSGSDAGVADAGESGSRRVLLSDEGNRRIVLVDLQNPTAAVWSRPLNDTTKYGDGMRDIQLVGGDRVAVSVLKGYVELDLKTGEIKKEVTSFTGVESLRRLPNGNTILGSNDGGVTLQELDPKDAVVSGHKVTFTNLQDLRLFRRTPQGTFLLGLRSKLVEVNWDKKTVWEMSIPDGDWVFQGLKVDKNVVATSGYGATLVIIDPTSKTALTKIGGKSQPDATDIVPNFYAGFQVLANGHYVVTNWEGHGGGNGGKGIQLLEYDTTGALVWKWKQDAKLVSSLHGAIVLDGLDTSKLHDDVNGVLAPVTE